MNPLATEIFFRRRWLWHLLFWVVAVFYLMLAFRGRSDTLTDMFFNTLIYLPAHIVFVYVNLYFLIPRFVLKKKFLAFAALFIPLMALSGLYFRFIDTHVFHSSEGFADKRLFLRALFSNLNLCGIAVAIKLFKYWYLETKAKQQAEKENLVSQLQLLKSQVHPHFLFNTLNNLYSLTLERSGTSSAVVLELSDLLRYMLYECDAPEIDLEKEIDILRKYASLEKLRFGDRLEISFSCSGEIAGKRIAPLLLLPFIENCFKHGASEQIDLCWISVDIEVNDDELHARFINSYLKNERDQQQHTGIGLQNVKKRLALLYPNTHSLTFTPGDETYIASLSLRLAATVKKKDTAHAYAV
jgi:sensor histidine kinase YesM